MCYRTIKPILGSCESLCLLTEFFFFGKKFKSCFLYFFFIAWFLLLWDCCGSLRVVVGSLWIIVGRCGSLWVIPGFSSYECLFV